MNEPKILAGPGNSGASAGASTSGPVASGGAGGSAPDVSGSSGAQVSVPVYGGNRGGRPRKDGFAPGSAEAIESDRAKDAERKRRAREAGRFGALPPALPSAGGAKAPAGVQSGGAVGGDMVNGSGPEMVQALAWEPKMLAPLFEQLIPTAEEMSVAAVVQRAEKARLPAPVLEAIETDARWNPAAKKALGYSGPMVAAKWLNKSGISAENQPEVVFCTAVLSIVAGQVLLLRRLNVLVKAANGQGGQVPTSEPEPEKEKKP